MSSNLTVSFLAEQARRELLPAQAERGWRAAQAATGAQGAGRGQAIRQAAGAALVRLGTRLGGVPAMPARSLRPGA
jgi:hypothetical protein